MPGILNHMQKRESNWGQQPAPVENHEKQVETIAKPSISEKGRGPERDTAVTKVPITDTTKRVVKKESPAYDIYAPGYDDIYDDF